MRPAKFFFALLFGAAVLITFLKLLLFGVMAAAVFGGLFFAFRAFRFLTAGRGYYHPGFGHVHYPPMQFQGYQNAQPLDNTRSFQGSKNPLFMRHIEVL